MYDELRCVRWCEGRWGDGCAWNTERYKCVGVSVAVEGEKSVWHTLVV